MYKREIKTIIRFLIQSIEESGVPVAKAIVFGSQVKRTTIEEGDIIVIIVSEDFRRKNIFKRVDMVCDAHMQTVKKFIVSLEILLKVPEEVEYLDIGEMDETIVFVA